MPPRARFFKKCGRMERQDVAESCRRVRWSSQVETVVGSQFRVANFLFEPLVDSKFRRIVQARNPQGSLSAMERTSRAMLGRRVVGSKTSPQDKCVCFAARSSASKRLDNALAAACSYSCSPPTLSYVASKKEKHQSGYRTGYRE